MFTPKRLVYFRGGLICKLFSNYNTIPNLDFEYATRTLSNLNNLVTIRGNYLSKTQSDLLILEDSMSGPHHYLGYIDPTQAYKIIDNRFIKINYLQINKKFKLNESLHCIYLNDYKWKSFCLEDSNNSLFANPGILQINDCKELNFEGKIIEDGYNYDLSKYKIQLVKNSSGFIFNQNEISKYKHAQHKLRIITYYYGNHYVDKYLINSSGIFIEKHEFIQSITPMNNKCSGYVIIGFYENDNLCLFAIRIPFGYTLLVEPFAIHGDSMLKGLYMMSMTGNHTAMGTADTVFLQDSNGKNILCYPNEYYSDLNDEKELDIKCNKILDIKKRDIELKKTCTIFKPVLTPMSYKNLFTIN